MRSMCCDGIWTSRMLRWSRSPCSVSTNLLYVDGSDRVYLTDEA